MKTGKLIVIEGSCDGVGKTTQINLLKERLEENGYQVIMHHFPSYNTYHGLPVEKYLNGEYGKREDLPITFINSLYANDRAITWYESLKKEYENGKIILLDRYTTSSLIYQIPITDGISEKEKVANYIMNYEYEKLGTKKPDQVIFLTMPFLLSTNLRHNRTNYDGNSKDIHEQDEEYLHEVYKNALFISDYLNWEKIECSENNQLRSIEDINNDVYQLVRKKLY